VQAALVRYVDVIGPPLDSKVCCAGALQLRFCHERRCQVVDNGIFLPVSASSLHQVELSLVGAAGCIRVALFDTSIGVSDASRKGLEGVLVTATSGSAAWSCSAVHVAALEDLGRTLVAHKVGMLACQKLVHPWLKRYLRARNVCCLERLSIRHIGTHTTGSPRCILSTIEVCCNRSFALRFRGSGGVSVAPEQVQHRHVWTGHAACRRKAWFQVFSAGLLRSTKRLLPSPKRDNLCSGQPGSGSPGGSENCCEGPLCQWLVGVCHEEERLCKVAVSCRLACMCCSRCFRSPPSSQVLVPPSYRWHATLRCMYQDRWDCQRRQLFAGLFTGRMPALVPLQQRSGSATNAQLDGTRWHRHRSVL